MSVASDILDRAERFGVQVEMAGDKLKLRAKRKPPNDLLDDLRCDLRAHKAEVLAFLSGDCWTDQNEECAAIAEYEGRVPPIWAEGLARLDPSRPPADVPPHHWLQFCNDCGRFCDDWAGKASDLGWTPLALFGCDRTRPFARLDRAGLLWLVEGRRIVVLTADTAAIEIPGGKRLTYRRKPNLDVEAG